VAALAFGPGFYPNWYFVLVAIGYGLLLPVLAVLQVRHATVRQSGAILGTAAGMATITVGIAASANPDLIVPALFVRGVWWWTLGRMWAETDVMPRLLGIATLVLAVVAIAAALASAPMTMDAATLWASERVILGVWSLALAYALWRVS
jgi:hypothetical protein